MFYYGLLVHKSLLMYKIYDFYTRTYISGLFTSSKTLTLSVTDIITQEIVSNGDSYST